MPRLDKAARAARVRSVMRSPLDNSTCTEGVRPSRPLIRFSTAPEKDRASLTNKVRMTAALATSRMEMRVVPTWMASRSKSSRVGVKRVRMCRAATVQANPAMSRDQLGSRTTEVMMRITTQAPKRLAAVLMTRPSIPVFFRAMSTTSKRKTAVM